jgi:hypothetical protein
MGPCDQEKFGLMILYKRLNVDDTREFARRISSDAVDYQINLGKTENYNSRNYTAFTSETYCFGKMELEETNFDYIL